VIVFKKFLIFVLRNKLVELTREREVSLIFIKSKDNLRAKTKCVVFTVIKSEVISILRFLAEQLT
jgi:hypothetical protein